MRRGVNPWLVRGLVVVVLTGVVGLWMLVRPASAPSTVPDAPTPSAQPTALPTSTPTPSPTSPPTQTPVPTVTPLPTIPPTPPPTLTPTPSPTPTLTAIPTASDVTTGTTVIHPPVAYPNAQLAGRVEQHTYFSQITGREEPYRIYLPPDYDDDPSGRSDRRYPVLYLFHGWPYDESHWDNLGADEVADAAIQAETLPPFIIVLPGADPDGIYVNTAGGDRSFEAQVINDLIPHIDATYRTQNVREGRAVGGISRGGVWSLEIAFRHTDTFAAVGAHSPALKDNMAPNVYDPFYLIQHPAVAGLRIYLDAGDVDWALPATQALHEALDKRSIPNQFAVHSGGHADGLWSASMGEYLAFYTAGWW